MDEEEISNCLAAMKTDPVKTALKVGIDDEISIHDMFTVMLNSTAFTKAVTEEAVERGAFGAPTMFFHQDGENEQMFWGSDRFEMVAQIYNTEWIGPNPNK